MPSCLAEYKSTHPRKFGNHVTVHRPTERSTVRPHHRDHCLLSYFLASLRAQEETMSIAHQCCDQLTAVKQSIRWSVSPDRTAGSSVDPSRSSIWLKLSADKLPVSNDRRFSSFFFPMIHMNYVDVLNSACRILQCWSYYVKINPKDINTTPKDLKTERDCSHRQLFRPLWGSSVWRNNQRKLW